MDRQRRSGFVLRVNSMSRILLHLLVKFQRVGYIYMVDYKHNRRSLPVLLIIVTISDSYNRMNGS